MLSDYELVFLIGETSSNISDMAINAFSVISAYLLVGFFLAARLSRPMCLFVHALYLVGLVMLGFQLSKHMAIVAAAVDQLKQRTVETGSLAWHPSNASPAWYMDAQPMAATILFLLIAIASIWFFETCRKREFTGFPLNKRSSDSVADLD
ncbi:MAG: hypothetical protein NXH88_03815 [Hyphomonas sp.]|nr:hypothetical protein [Hyphomonas sp.]